MHTMDAKSILNESTVFVVILSQFPTYCTRFATACGRITDIDQRIADIDEWCYRTGLNYRPPHDQ